LFMECVGKNAVDGFLEAIALLMPFFFFLIMLYQRNRKYKRHVEHPQSNVRDIIDSKLTLIIFSFIKVNKLCASRRVV